MKKFLSAFTLLELTLTLSIIAIVLSISLPLLSGLFRENLTEEIYADLAILQLSLEDYYSARGYFPPDILTYQQELMSTGILEAKLTDRYRKGVEYEYKLLAVQGRYFYLVCSVGPDGISQVNDHFLATNIDGGVLFLPEASDDIFVTNLLIER